MKKIILLAITSASLLNVFGQKAQPVIEAEKSFAKHALDFSTKQAFLKYMDSAAVVFNRGVISNGIQTWLQLPEGPGKLIWGPTYAVMSASADLGFTTGAYESRVNDTVRGSGQYTTVWNKTEKGEWRFLVDLGVFYRPTQWGKQPAVFSFENLTPADSKDTSVAALETKFIQSFTTKGYQAYEEFIDENTWMNFDFRVPLYHIDVKQLDFIPAELKFIPVQGRTSSAKDLAFMYGTTDLNGKKENYLHVWGHTKQGWKLLVQVLKWQK